MVPGADSNHRHADFQGKIWLNKVYFTYTYYTEAALYINCISLN